MLNLADPQKMRCTPGGVFLWLPNDLRGVPLCLIIDGTSDSCGKTNTNSFILSRAYLNNKQNL
jgi:hypothetical protein